ncbi:Hypothetical protein R9X50_00074600 [Acrodontium crateriforme]|uniref:THUMP domain-containing protein n=1 Tax=Acrodontium crateriforme TaxID=150365 RepID=A0AAQ3LXW1_9PEZI|nr:Hypothetical protein R9X50_00074600 [Acrodontium crateriforme]
MEQGVKRKAESHEGGPRDKRTKSKKQWQVPRNNQGGSRQVRVIQPGDSGIWVTCNKGKEAKCIGELRDLFNEYAELLYADQLPKAKNGDDDDDDDDDAGVADIESEIKAEVAGITKPSTEPLFTHIKLDVQCVVFFKTVAPVEPVSFVKRICEDAMRDPGRKRTRFAQRLSPMTLMGRPTTEGLERVAKEVLAPHFHQEPFQSKKAGHKRTVKAEGFIVMPSEQFAIRPTLRNHNILTRDSIIKQVASLVGPGHKVDLKEYDLLIVVEVYQNICGVSVVDNNFERLKRYNVAEIFDPTPKESAAAA